VTEGLKHSNHCGKLFVAQPGYFYVTDRYKVYQRFINDVDQIVDKTYMTRVEGENTRLRHYDRSVTSQNERVIRSSVDMLKYSVRLQLY
jgi:IS1 family transposase